MPLSQLDERTSPLDGQRLSTLKSALGGLSSVQVAWVSGYLAAVAEQQSVAAPPTPQGEVITILYGSQTGNAKTVAERLDQRLRGQGLGVNLHSMDDFAPRGLSKARMVLIVVSTHGDGEPPESAFALHSFLMAPRAPRLDALQYAVLGLGDSSYEHFCRTAQDFDRRLAELGAKRVLPLRCCDVDYETDAESWRTDALDRLAARAQSRSRNVIALSTHATASANAHSRDNPYVATLLEKRRITMRHSVADVRHIVLGVDAAALPYQPGDALAVCPRNHPALADMILAQLNLDGELAVESDSHAITLRDALIEHKELTRLHPSTVTDWSKRSPRSSLKDIAKDPARLRAFVARNQFSDLIAAYPADIDAQGLMQLLPALKPRLYSIASSRAEYDDEIHLTVSLVGSATEQPLQLGAASGLVCERLAADDPVPVYIAENDRFHLPPDGDTPIVMIAAGTGIAPYRAFLQQRAADGHTGRNWLVFGNRHYKRDFLYQLDWQAHRKAGLLQRVSVAFSRDQADRVYVQDRLLAEGPTLYQWLREGAHVYVCGGTAMGQSVHDALVNIVATEGQIDPEAAVEYVEQMRREARYHRDLY
jgi:sulfite reductase (NADPH) flavoprotein alpha-component